MRTGDASGVDELASACDGGSLPPSAGADGVRAIRLIAGETGWYCLAGNAPRQRTTVQVHEPGSVRRQIDGSPDVELIERRRRRIHELEERLRRRKRVQLIREAGAQIADPVIGHQGDQVGFTRFDQRHGLRFGHRAPDDLIGIAVRLGLV
jgi:hypothetical protein